LVSVATGSDSLSFVVSLLDFDHVTGVVSVAAGSGTLALVVSLLDTGFGLLDCGERCGWVGCES